MKDLLPIKKSHIIFYHDFPLYYISKEGEPLLYKAAGEKLDQEAIEKNQFSQFFITREDRNSIIKKLQSVLNIGLAKAISEKGVMTIKKCLCQIVEEALQGPIEKTLFAIPETIEILLSGVHRDSDLLHALTAVNSNSHKIVEHSINVLALTLQYCFFKKFSEKNQKLRSLCSFA